MGKFTAGKDVGFLQRMFGKSYTAQQVQKYEQDKGLDYERSFGYLANELESAIQNPNKPSTFQGTDEDWLTFRDDFTAKTKDSPYKFSISAAEAVLGRGLVKERLTGVAGLGVEYFATDEDIANKQLKRYDGDSSNTYKDEEGNDRHDINIRTTQVDGDGNPIQARTNDLTTGQNQADDPDSAIGEVNNAQRDAMFHNIALELVNDSGGRVSYGPSALERSLINEQKAITSGNRQESIDLTNALADQFTELGITVNDVDNPTKEISSVRNPDNSLTQDWNKVRGAGEDNSFAARSAAFMENDSVIDVKPENFTAEGFSVSEGKEPTGANLMRDLKQAKAYLVDGIKPDLLAKSGPNPFISLLKLGDTVLTGGAAQRAAETKQDKRFKILQANAKGEFTANSIEELFSQAQWDSLSEAQKKEAFALAGEINLNNNVNLQAKKLKEVKKPENMRGLSQDEARAAITNNRNYKDFFSGEVGQKNINAILKDPVVAEDFKNLNAQEFANKYSTDGKFDETRLIGNNFSKEGKQVLDRVVSKTQIKEFEKAIADGDQTAIDKVLDGINLTDDEESLLVKMVQDTSGDFRLGSSGSSGKGNLRALYITTVANMSKDGFQYKNLTQKDTYTNLIEGGILSSFGLDSAKKQIELQKSILESSQEVGQMSDDFKGSFDNFNGFIKELTLDDESLFDANNIALIGDQLNTMKLNIKNEADVDNYIGNRLRVIKRFAVKEFQPGFWQEFFTLTFAKGVPEASLSSSVSGGDKIIVLPNGNLKIKDKTVKKGLIKNKYGPEIYNELVSISKEDAELRARLRQQN